MWLKKKDEGGADYLVVFFTWPKMSCCECIYTPPTYARFCPHVQPMQLNGMVGQLTGKGEVGGLGKGSVEQLVVEFCVCMVFIWLKMISTFVFFQGCLQGIVRPSPACLLLHAVQQHYALQRPRHQRHRHPDGLHHSERMAGLPAGECPHS